MEFKAPNEIKIGDYYYTKKDKLMGDYYSYRCKKRSECKLQIKINKEELKKIINNTDTIVNYTITSRNTKKHECNFADSIISEEIDPKKTTSLSDKNIKEKAKELLIRNLDKHFLFHKDNLKNNNFQLSDNQIKWLLQVLREKSLPPDPIFLFNIDKITIRFDNEETPFCYSYYNNLAYENKKYIYDKFCIFTSIFQINMFKKCSQIFFDATYKSCPKTMYQLFNIAGYLEETDGLIPLMIIPMSNKTQRLYTVILKEVVRILTVFNINIEKITNKFMSDFEIALRRSIKEVFPNCILDGCFFHYTKLLWKHAKILGLCKKNEIKNTKIFLFLLKLYPYIKLDEKKNFFKELEEYYITNSKYKNFLEYYKKSWIDSEFVNMDVINRNEYLNRTNNHLESFHNFLNNTIDSFHPKISYFVEKLKTIVLLKYEDYKNSIKKPKIPHHQKYSLTLDIYNFIENYNKKYYSSISPKLIIQGDNEETSKINNIIEKIIDTYFDMDNNLVFSNQYLDIKFETKNDNVINGDDDVEQEEEDINLKNEKTKHNEKVDKIETENLMIESHYLNEAFKSKKKRKHYELENELSEFYSSLLLKSKNKI